MKHSIVMVSDFFFPNFGGVENHIYQLSQCLINNGHKVVIITHAYEQRCGVRYLTNGLKVYYVPRRPFYLQNTLPTFVGSFRLFRHILLRERATLVHAHQAFSTMAHEAILQARTMGYKVVFTDHSLFGFAQPGSILMNKVLKFTLSDIQHAICVSHTSKENTVLRACLAPHRVSVIPNAVDATQFTPDPTCRPPHRLVIVTLSRLVYRKGIDLLAAIIPAVCARHPHVDFLIGGDGHKRALLERVVQEEDLCDRVTLAGAVPHEHARDLLVKGHIFLNASLTEAFCMALVEAAAAGLLVVSTSVGGVPEVLPDDMVVLTDPSPEALLAGVEHAIQRIHHIDPWAFHTRVGALYSWQQVSARTERVYDDVACGPDDAGLVVSLCRYYKCGPLLGKLAVAVMMVLWVYWRVLEWVWPAAGVEHAKTCVLLQKEQPNKTKSGDFM